MSVIAPFPPVRSQKSEYAARSAPPLPDETFSSGSLPSAATVLLVLAASSVLWVVLLALAVLAWSWVNVLIA